MYVSFWDGIGLLGTGARTLISMVANSLNTNNKVDFCSGNSLALTFKAKPKWISMIMNRDMHAWLL